MPAGADNTLLPKHNGMWSGRIAAETDLLAAHTKEFSAIRLRFLPKYFE
jgi:hypothetical protein